MTGLYIHVPFCVKKCNYCDFYSISADETTRAAYLGALFQAAEPYRGERIDTVYFGGGNPLLLSAGVLADTLARLSEVFVIEPGAEITAEANPEDLTPARAAVLRSAGFTRLSIGVQSLNDATLSLLGRRHSAATALAAVETAARAGFSRLSADLMLALPGESAEETLASARRTAELPLDHVSAYILKIEEGTRFWRERASLALPDDDAAADLYLGVCAALEGAGFAQYEISNFAKPGGRSRHNMKYWTLEPYIGLGPAAHSFFGGRRFFYPRSLGDFIARPRETTDDGAGGGSEEFIALSLRLTDGLDLRRLREEYGIEADREKLAAWERAGLGQTRDERFSLTPAGFLVSNSIITELI